MYTTTGLTEQNRTPKTTQLQNFNHFHVSIYYSISVSIYIYRMYVTNKYKFQKRNQICPNCRLDDTDPETE